MLLVPWSLSLGRLPSGVLLGCCRSISKNYTSHLNAFFAAVLQDLGGFVDGLAPVLAPLGADLLIGLLPALQGGFVGGAFLGRVNPLLGDFTQSWAI